MSSRQVGSNTSALGRRRRCGNGAARVAEPAFATACFPREAFRSLPSAPWPPRGRERVRGAGRPARKAPLPRGGPGARGGPARAGSGAAPRRGGLARTRRGGGRGALRAAGGATGPAPPRTSPGGRANSPRHRPSPGNAPCPLPFPRPSPLTPPAASPPRGGFPAAAAAAAGSAREAGSPPGERARSADGPRRASCPQAARAEPRCLASLGLRGRSSGPEFP